MPDRVWRAMMAVDAEPSATAGRRAAQKAPGAGLGSQPSVTENSNIIIRPSQKIGIDMPTSDTSVARLSQMCTGGLTR